MKRCPAISPRILSTFALLLLLAAALGACVADEEEAKLTPRAQASSNIGGNDDWEKHNTITASGEVGALLACSTNYDCGYGGRCWYGTCTAGGVNCTSNCDCGLGKVCGIADANGIRKCTVDFGPYPECHCNPNCASGVCSNGGCQTFGGGGGGGGGEQPTSEPSLPGRPVGGLPSESPGSEPPPGGFPSDPKGPPPKL